MNNFTLTDDKKTNSFYGKIVLIDIQRYLDNNYNDGNQAPIINIVKGKINETIKIPKIKKNTTGIYDPAVVEYEAVDYIIPKARNVEILFPEPAILIGGGVDFVGNSDRKGNASATNNVLIPIVKGSTKPKKFPENPYYCILPTQ